MCKASITITLNDDDTIDTKTDFGAKPIETASVIGMVAATNSLLSELCCQLAGYGIEDMEDEGEQTPESPELTE